MYTRSLSYFIIVLFLFQAPLFAMHKKKQKTPEPISKGYDALWKEVESAEGELKTQEAQKLVEEIFILSKKEVNVPQTIKAIIHQGKYLNILNEESELLFINLLKTEIKRSIGEEKAILQSLLAEVYMMYYNQNQYKFQGRTYVSESEKLIDDFRTWDLMSIYNEVSKLYLSSVSEKELLITKPLVDYVSILENVTKESTLISPTLYDFLANRAIDFFSNKQMMLQEPINVFKLDKTIYFNETASFIDINLDEKTTIKNNLYYATSLFQNLLKYRLSATEKDAYLSAELKRLKFVKDNYTSENGNLLYRNSLSKIASNYEGVPTNALLRYEIIKSLADEIESEDKEGVSFPTIIEMCDKVIKQYPESMGANNCNALKSYIYRKNLSVQMEQYLVPQSYFKALISYKNTHKVYLNIVKLEDIEKDYNNINYDERVKKLMSLPSVKKWEVALPNVADFRAHSVEIAIEPLASGEYALLVSDDNNFSTKQQAIIVNTFSVTSISYLSKNNTQDGSIEVFVMDRKQGFSLPFSKVKIAYWEYDYNQRKNIKKEGETYTTDKDGYVKIKETYQNRNLFFEISYKDEVLNTGNSQYFYKNNPHNEPTTITTHFFTDRAIYRPGQTVYFKGVITKFDSETNTLVKERSTTVTLRDFNYKEISTLTLVSNEFGSINGEFILPLNGITGAFTIENESGNTTVNVEEYKRPTFEVSIEKPKNSYALGEEVTITGNATTFFGTPIIDGVVKYRVVRKTHYPYPRRFRCWLPFPTSADKEIAFGEMITNNKGDFNISFEAMPDGSIDKSLKPVFTYQITADVTDLSGETRSGEQDVLVGYVSLLANIQSKDSWKINEQNKVEITTTNLNGEPQNAQVKVVISKLKTPSILKNNKYWGKPDSYILSEKDHDKLFPQEEYLDENNPLNWEVETVVYSQSFYTKEKSKVDFIPNTFKNVGVYKIDLTCLQETMFPIEVTKIITLEAENSKQLALPEPLKLYVDNPVKEGGKKAEIKVASSYQNARVIVDISYNSELLERKIIVLNNEIKTINFDLKPEYKQRIEVQASLIYNNKSYIQQLNVNIPEPSKTLQVEWLSFRDNMQPGKKETWKLKIKGPKGEKVAVELLATMYDASLETFTDHNFYFNLRNKYLLSSSWWKQDNFNIQNGQFYNKNWNNYLSYEYLSYPILNLFDFRFSNYYHMYGNTKTMMRSSSPLLESAVMKSVAPSAEVELYDMVDDEIGSGKREDKKSSNQEPNISKEIKPTDQPLRTNLKETAFFFPNLQTDNEGNVIIEFTSPEALTKWKLLGFALDKELDFALFSKEAITQKELMIIPHLPRFLREKDEITLTAKIFNVTEKTMVGKANLKLINALTNEDITSKLIQGNANQNFEIDSKGNIAVSWKVLIPQGLQAVNYEVFATSGNTSDGEGGMLPVLTNRMLVTETMPMQVLDNETKNYVLDKLKNNTSSTLTNHQFTLEITENPVWYAIQALPYLMEYPYECVEQTFNRLYANAIAGHITESNPAIKKTFELWKNLPDSKALISNLEKNQELKMLLIEETPWLRDAENETEQKKRIALLFDLNKMSQEQSRAIQKILQMQTSNGGFTWFPGMQDNRYITQYIVSGYAHLLKLGVSSIAGNKDLKQAMDRAVQYLDARIVEDLAEIKKHKAYLENDYLGYYAVQYLYARTFFPNIKMDKNTTEANSYFINQAKKYWTSRSEQMKSMIAIALNKTDNQAVAKKIIESLRQNAITSEEKGMYWKAVEGGGYYWYNAGIETQALLIEAFDEVGAQPKEINGMKLWLLKQKQVQKWSSTKATAEACYALLLRGSDWLSNQRSVEVTVGTHKISSATVDNKEAGTGYFKQKWDTDKITPDMGNVQIKGVGEGVSWGAIYWQYFEDLDKITPAQTPLSLTKELYKEVLNANGLQLVKIDNDAILNVGDKIKVRIILKSDRNMEYIHLKDMRSSGFEPINVFSSYKYQDGLGYYESTRDAATNFFIDYLPKGVFVFEYPLRVTHKGDFSNGITSVQSMYAPEFSAHSKGVRVKVK